MYSLYPLPHIFNRICAEGILYEIKKAFGTLYGDSADCRCTGIVKGGGTGGQQEPESGEDHCGGRRARGQRPRDGDRRIKGEGSESDHCENVENVFGKGRVLCGDDTDRR